MNTLKSIQTIFLILGICYSGFTQSKGIIKGQIIDQQSEIPLIGATIELADDNGVTGTTTDLDGYFALPNVKIGRRALLVSYLGYETLTIPNIDVTSGKEVSLQLKLTESITKLDEVVITADALKDRAQNEMATISARQFGMEEVTRYAGGRSDVGRLAANFAGVSAPDDSRNDIVIRGNSPTGVLWQLEGIPIPNPNHYSTFGTTGGPVSAMNPNMLRNSDFLTSAFPAEYGNAIGGVFDLSFRNGNKDRMEYTLQLGAFSGIEAIVEGPLGKNNGSFLVAGRYSFVGIVGAGVTSAVPDYSDLSFKLDFGKSKFGNFSLFGIGGRSEIRFIGDDIEEGDLYALKDENNYVQGGFGVVGLKHNILLSDKSYIRTIIGTTLRKNKFESERYFDKGSDIEALRTVITNDNTENTYSISSYFNSKVNSKTTFRAGILAQQYGINNLFMNRSDTQDTNNDGIRDWVNVYDIEESVVLIQPFAQMKYRLTEKLSANIGLHSQWSNLNEQLVLEPRTSLQYNANPKHSFNAGFGIHHQNAPLPILFLNKDNEQESTQPNRKLDFIESKHFVLGHDFKVAKDWRVKTEVYYQAISSVPVDPFPSTYSTLVEGADFVFQTDKVDLLSNGTGSNRGIELTLEKFYSNGYHALVTGSFFESRYTASDQVERSTPFDNGYVINVLAGKEIPFGKTGKNAFVVDTKFTTSGGRHYTPVDLDASQYSGFEVLLTDQAYSLQYAPYLRLDLKFGVKLNSLSKKISHQLFFDFQNVTNRENIFIDQYNRLTNQVEQLNQVGFFPDFLYRVQF